MSDSCPFCSEPVNYYVKDGTAGAFYDRFPVNEGHTLVVPFAHRSDLRDCLPEEVADIWKVVEQVISHLQTEYNPDGFNIGTNLGASAGQTVFHCHVHVIPRFVGDTANPRGGVRLVKESLVPYEQED
jgi:diadenosine tetraphosphate (Ap4A) HIT family hydrolase